MTTYGYNHHTLVTDIDPDIQVKKTMNRINAADREKTVAEFEAEASRIEWWPKPKQKAATSTRTRYCRSREVGGLVESVDVLNRVGINSQEASAPYVVTQHYDTQAIAPTLIQI
jgi:hypothetical protein